MFNPQIEFPPVPSWSIEIKDGKVVYCETTTIGTVETGKWQTVTFSRNGKDTRMTEKEFFSKSLGLDGEIRSTTYRETFDIVRRALELAKQHGAKFDPEPIELPKLRTCGGPKACLIGSSNKEKGLSLSSEEATEVIRRCELIPRLRKYVVENVYPRSNALLDMIDGRDVQSAEGEDHAINP